MAASRARALAALLAVLLLSLVAPVSLTRAAPLAPYTVVRPSALNGWGPANVAGTGTVAITSAYPRDGIGSLQFTTSGGSGKADFMKPWNVPGRTLDALTALSYSFYRDGSSTSAAHHAPVLRLHYLTPSGEMGNLIWEPVYNGYSTVPANQWHAVDLFSTGHFWMRAYNPSRTIDIYDITLAEWLSGMNNGQPIGPDPNGDVPHRLVPGTRIYAVETGVGSGWSGTFAGASDDIYLAFGADIESANFEPDCSGGTVTNTDTVETFCSIQAAIDDPDTTNGHKISIGPGTYRENLTINKSLELAGAGTGQTTIHPATSGPTCTGGGGTYCTGSVHTILVGASNVKIHDLTVDGDNPALTSGVVRGGADLDARTGISHAQAGGPYNNLQVYNTAIRNIYLRALYNSSTSSTGFYFHDNTVQNVRGDGGSIGIFAWASSGRIEDNSVSDVNDAIAANHSMGIQFLRNTVTNADSGIHSDNFGDSGVLTADLIRNNQVSDCSGTGGFGIWLFVPYAQATVQQNTVTNCAVGLALFGQEAPTTVSALFTGNTVTGSGADSYGAYVTTNIAPYGTRHATARFSGNSFSNVQVGIEVEELGPDHDAEAFVESNTITGLGRTVADGYGVNILAAARATVGSTTFDNSKSNDISGFAEGIRIAGTGIVRGNFGSIRDNATGIHVLSGGTSTIEGNDILNSDVGLWYESDAVSDKLYCNNIQSPSDVGVQNDTGASFVAEYNYWDDPAGPMGPNGDKIQGTLVDYSPFSVQPVTTTTCEALVAVLLDSLTATSNSTGTMVEVAWTTVSELDTLGFHLYRRAEGEPEARLTTALVEATGGTQGANYKVEDGTVVMGTTYTYRLEALGTDGESATLGEVSVTPAVPTAVTLGTLDSARPLPWAALLGAAGLVLAAAAAWRRRR